MVTNKYAQAASEEQIKFISAFAATRQRTVDGPEMSDHREADQVRDGHDYDGCQRRVRDVEEQRSEERQSQQHQRSYTAQVSSAVRNARANNTNAPTQHTSAVQ